VSTTDAANAAYWNELCGTAFARSVGVTENTPEQLDRYDAAYLELYPFLRGYLDALSVDGRSVLEIGPGYGTIGRELLRRGASYSALDVAASPVTIAADSLARYGQPTTNAVVGSILAAPFADESFDRVVAVGSLHHAGDLEGAIVESRRILRRHGVLLLMVYNARSLNRLVTTPVARLAARCYPRRADWILSRTHRDLDTTMRPAPHTDFVSRSRLRELLGAFDSVRIEARGASPISVHGRTLVSAPFVRRLLEPSGTALDLYAVARR
jgi:SAM-dependent methyltransferase